MSLEHWNVDIIESSLLTSEHIYAVVRQCSTPEKNLMGFSTHYIKVKLSLRLSLTNVNKFADKNRFFYIS